MKLTGEGTKVLDFPDSKVNESAYAEAMKQTVRERSEWGRAYQYSSSSLAEIPLMPHEKGRIRERVVEYYINGELIPSLKKNEGWTDIVYTKAKLYLKYPDEYLSASLLHPFAGLPMTHRKAKEARILKLWEEKSARRWRAFKKLEDEKEERILIVNGFYPTKEFLNHFKHLTDSLSNMPDGFLIKMKRTETSKTTNEAIKEELANNDEFIDEEWVFQKLDKNRVLSVVNGTIQVVEVKSEKSNCNPLQTLSYRTAIANGYPLRLFRVDLNSFIIKEKLIMNPRVTAENKLDYL